VAPALWPPLQAYIMHKLVIISTLYLCCSHLEAAPASTLLLKLSTLHFSPGTTPDHTDSSCLEIPPVRTVSPISEHLSTLSISKCFIHSTNTHQAELATSHHLLNSLCPVSQTGPTLCFDSTELATFSPEYCAFFMLPCLFSCYSSALMPLLILTGWKTSSYLDDPYPMSLPGQCPDRPKLGQVLFSCTVLAPELPAVMALTA